MSLLTTQALLSLFISVIIMRGPAEGITITRLSLPTPLAVGEGGVLECDWTYDGDHVYTLKWYSGIREFYRWTPQETPPAKAFPIDARFRVDLGESEGGRVKIFNVTLAATGRYRCEVSGEAPTFQTSYESDIITVVDLPDERPVLSTGGKEHFRLGDVIGINCSSHGAKPAPELSFYVNDVTVDPIWMTEPLVTTNNATMLETAWRGLIFSLGPGQVERGQVRVKCVASYPKLYWKSSEVILQVLGAEGLAGASGFNSQGFLLTDIAPSFGIAPVLLFLPCLHVIAAFF
ncbi:uncharacterized protein LOC122248465 [Penaeus japonicus]|uniref:uncharacterized protein LOC122248465 n=1 Tax=Penaeus japonicus TaxID=27405 RepID=UPI001C714355|nr:uncharacterized protein LOC122248465 [Penaeus japonicus]